MLVLSRKVGQRILIGDKIAVTVVKIGHGGVRIGVDAPPELVAIAFPSFFQILDVNGGGLDPVDDEAAGARGRGFGPWCLDHGDPRGLETFNRRFDSRGHARLKPVEEVRARHADSEITPP